VEQILIQYSVAPEVVRGEGYSYSCDWWSLSVTIFGCLMAILQENNNNNSPLNVASTFDLMQQLLCEPEDRLGSQASISVTCPNLMIVQARRSALIATSRATRSVDGAELVKAHPFLRGVDWTNIRRYPAPFRLDLRDPEDTRHFDDDIPAESLAPANGAPPDAARDPLLRDKVHGQEIWTSARHSRSRDSLIKVPERSAMSAQTRHLTRNQIPQSRGPFYAAFEPRNRQRARDFNVICMTRDD